LHVRVLVRAARRAAALPAVPPGSRGVRAHVSRAAGDGRLRLAGGPRRTVRSRPSLDRYLARSIRGAGRLARRSRDARDAGRAVETRRLYESLKYAESTWPPASFRNSV